MDHKCWFRPPFKSWKPEVNREGEGQRGSVTVVTRCLPVFFLLLDGRPSCPLVVFVLNADGLAVMAFGAALGVKPGGGLSFVAGFLS